MTTGNIVKLRPVAFSCFLLVGTILQANLSAEDWPQWLGPQRDGIWRESGLLAKFPEGGPVVRWRVPVGGGYAGPAVADGRVYLTDRFPAENASIPADAFARGEIPGVERVLCVSERDGKVLWEHRYDCRYTVSYPAGPRATPLVHQGKVYTLGAEGDLYCLEAGTGETVWSVKLPEAYGIKTPMWGFAGHPLIDGDRLICLVGGQGSVAVAFHKETGREVWRALSAKEPGYCPPVIYELDGKRQLILWHPEGVNGLNPVTGELYWTVPTDVRYGLTIPMPRQQGDKLFLTSFYNGSLMLRVRNDEPEVLWKSRKASEKDTEMLHSIMPTPAWVGDYLYGVCSYGQLRCLSAEDGERIWETFAATTGVPTRWGNAFLIQQANRFFLFNELGELILARLSPDGYEEISRASLLKPTGKASGRSVLWSHPAFANRSVYARNDEELICVSLGQP